MGKTGWAASTAGRLIAGAVLLGLAATLAVTGGLLSVIPTPRGAMSWRQPVPVDQELRVAAREANWPMVWIGEICDAPLYQLRGARQLLNATYAAACLSRVKPGGEADNLMVARYANVALAQQDLHSEGYTFYILRPWGGSLFMAATTSDDTVVDTHGHEVSASLQPLELFSLPILQGPGVP